MGTVAKSSITLVSISDAYSLSLTPNSCVIKADFDGSNPKLEHAYTIISAYCGDEKTPIEIDSSTIVKSNDNIEYQLIKVDSYRYRLSIISLPIDILQGYIEIPVLSGVSTGLTGRFTFSIIRESTMLDWIQDWESNKTTIGSSYVITPKLFVGKKIIGSYDSLEDVPGLTGVYIGPSENNGAGIYGYKDNKEIFHIDQTGGKIGGWDITSGGIQCEDGTLSIKSEGTISAQSEGIIHWLLNKDGSASFANGNVTMDVEGNALFKGTIETSGGSIAGWTIGVDSIYNGSIGINSLKKFIAIANVTSVQDTGDQLDWVKEYGGVAMYYISNADYGLIGYKNNEKVFSAGSKNFIAGWQFDKSAIWLGTKNNNVGQYTSTSGSITIGTNGFRGYSWFINADGSASFANGNVTMDVEGNALFKGTIETSGGSIAGWTIGVDSIYNGSIGINSLKKFIAIANVTSVQDTGDQLDWVKEYGGVAMYYISNADYGLIGYKNNEKVFSAGSKNFIAGWQFDKSAIWLGTKNNNVGQYTSTSGSITIGTNGFRGYSWFINADGSASFANGNFFWDTKGNVTLNGKIIATSGTIGDIEIYEDHIGTTSTPNSSGSGQWAGLSIYKDFFKVGGSKGYVMFGNDVIPASTGGAFTAVGRIVNQAPNTSGGYGYDQANYGLFIEVTGGTKNYGISSNAALKAPSFINTKAALLTFDSGNYTIDFSQFNVILMYFNDPNYDVVEVTLPNESSVARQFGVNNLPTDFATVITFRVRSYSKDIILKNIYDHNENMIDYRMVKGDSIIVLISKIDGFRYQILNHSH